MTETFKASNGWYIDENGEMRDHSDDKILYASDVNEAQQFFREKRDHELGRWRSKKDPSWTAVRDGEIVCFQNEDGKRSFSVNAEVPTNQWWSADSQEIEREYFAAHPQHKPLPEAIGLYVNATDMREFPHNTCVLTHDYEGWHIYGEPEGKARAIAQVWHDAGELVRLVPEGGDDDG